MGKYLTIKGADFSNVAIDNTIAYKFITKHNFRYYTGIYYTDNSNVGNALMVIPMSESQEPYPLKGDSNEYTLIDVPKEAIGVKITTVDSGIGLYHGVNLESVQ